MRQVPPVPDCRIRRSGWGRGLARAEQGRGADAVEPRLRGLAALLSRCAQGEPGAVAELRHWDGGRLQQMLMRMLDDPERARTTLERLLADLGGSAGAFRGRGETAAQDWLFARMRLAVRETGGLPPLRPMQAPPAAPEPATTWRQPEPVAAAGLSEPQAPSGMANPRLRPPGAPMRAPGAAAKAPPPRRMRVIGRWLGIGLLLAAAAASGLAGSLLAVRWLAPPAEPPAPVAEVAIAPEPVAPPPATQIPEPAAPPTPQVEIGPPIAARDLPVVAEPVAREQPAPAPTVAPAVAAPPRLVIHHGVGEESVAVAQQLAGQLRAAGYGEVAVRPVSFDVATASVRYFFTDDRAIAERLVRAIAPFLSWHGRAAPSTPIGFTDFRPLPRQGTLEIWLPRR
jgi:hypothetical protein